MQLMLGDCLDRMKEIPDGSVDLVISSPPYGIGKEYEVKTSLDMWRDWQRQVLVECGRTIREGGAICWQVGNYVDTGSVYPLDCILFGDILDIGLRPRNRIIWSFGHGLHCKRRFSGRHETILWFTKGGGYTFNLDDVRVPSKYPQKRHYKGPRKGQLSGNPLGKNPEDVWNIPNVKHNHPEKTPHPCQFPEALCDRLIRALSNRGNIVLDPFMGSGTTGVACVTTGRKFIGIERDEGYFQIARSRIAQALSEMPNGKPIVEDIFG